MFSPTTDIILSLGPLITNLRCSRGGGQLPVTARQLALGYRLLTGVVPGPELAV